MRRHPNLPSSIFESPAPRAPRHEAESGQASIQLVLILTIVLMPMLGFGVDLSNMWFHRQETQNAADSACQAGALDLFANASGVASPNSSFTTFVAGAPSNCQNLSGSSLCKYAGLNGYSGSGFNANAPSNSVAWTFPTAVTGAPTNTGYTHPFLQVTVLENVKTWFMTWVGKNDQAVSSTCTCGLVGVPASPPIVVLDPVDSKTLEFGGGAVIKLIGGAQRSIQINSSSTTAVQCDPSGEIDLSLAGPAGTGGDLGVYGGPSTNPACNGSPYENLALDPGSSGNWKNPAFPVADPFAGVAAPTQPGTSPTATTPEIVTYGQDGCPDHSPTNYVSTTPHSGCIMYEPGYYPSGISQGGNDVVIFKPGVYYMNGSLSIGGSDDARPATPCKPSCSPYSSSTSKQTDGTMFYFIKGQLNINGGSGALASSRVDAVNSTALTCDGSAPPANVGMPSTVNGNVLIGMCMTNGTYVDSYGDTTDSVSSTGIRGILIFEGHSNQVTSDSFSGSGTLAFSGSMYYHDTNNSSTPSSFSVSGGSGTTTYMLGDIIADKILLTGSGKINMALDPGAHIPLMKVALLN